MDPIMFHLPVKPYDIVGAINRSAAATGSVRYAMAAAHADYNGHGLTLAWNDYRGYYVGEYFFGGREVIVRSPDFAEALAASKKFYADQGMGASLRVHPREQDVPLARADADLIEGEENVRTKDWWTWKHDRVSEALRSRTDDLLIAARDLKHYEELGYDRRFPNRPPAVAV
jgi:hypothetical protein